MVGTTTVDVVLTGMDALPAAGLDEFTTGTIALLDDPVSFRLGGNGAITAAAYARLAAGGGDAGSVELVSAVGNDELGRMAEAWLRDAGVGLDALRRGRDATACTVVATDRSRRRLALHHAGMSLALGPDDIAAELVSGASAVLLTSYHLLPRFRGEPGAALLRRARKGGAFTALDPGPCVEPFADLDELEPILRQTDAVLANAYEIATISGGTGAGALVAAGARAVVEKRGAEGSCYTDAAAETVVPAVPVEASVTVGAGDAFDAGFLYALGRGLDPAAALGLGNETAAAVLANALFSGTASARRGRGERGLTAGSPG